MSLMSDMAAYSQGLKNLGGTPARQTFADRLTNDVQQSASGLFAGLFNLGSGGIHDTAHALHLTGGSYQTPRNVGQFYQGFQDTSPLPALLSGHPIVAAERWNQHPFSGSLDLLSGLAGAGEALGSGSQALARTGLLSAPATDRLMSLSGYHRAGDLQPFIDSVAHRIPDGLEKTPELALMNPRLDETIPITRGGVDMHVPAGEYSPHSTGQMPIDIGDTTYLRRTQRSLHLSGIHQVDPEAQSAVDKLQGQTAQTPAGLQLRARNEIAAQLGDKINMLHERYVPDSMKVFGRAERLMRRSIRTITGENQADSDMHTLQHNTAVGEFLHGDNGLGDLPQEEQLQSLARATIMSSTGATAEHAPGFLELADRQNTPAITRAPDELYNLGAMHDKLLQTSWQDEAGHAPAERFEAIFGQRPQGDWLVPAKTYWGVLKAKTAQWTPADWKDRAGLMIRQPLNAEGQHFSPAVMQGKTSQGVHNDQIRESLDLMDKASHDQSFGYVLTHERGGGNWGLKFEVDDVVPKLARGEIVAQIHPFARALQHVLRENPEIDKMGAAQMATRRVLGSVETNPTKAGITHLNIDRRSIPVPIDDGKLQQLKHVVTGDLPHVTSDLVTHSVLAAREPLVAVMETLGRLVHASQSKEGLERAIEDILVKREGVVHDTSESTRTTVSKLADVAKRMDRAELVKVIPGNLLDNARQLTNRELVVGVTKLLEKLGPAEAKMIQGMTGVDRAGMLRAIKTVHSDERMAEDYHSHAPAQMDDTTVQRSVFLHHPTSQEGARSVRQFMENMLDGVDEGPLGPAIDSRLEAQHNDLQRVLEVLRKQSHTSRKFVDELEQAYLDTHTIDPKVLHDESYKGQHFPSKQPEGVPGFLKWVRELREDPTLLPVMQSPAFAKWLQFHHQRLDDLEGVGQRLYSEWMSDADVVLGRGREASWLAGIMHDIDQDATTTHAPELHEISQRVAEMTDGKVQLDPALMRYVPQRSHGGEVVSAVLTNRKAANALGDTSLGNPREGAPHWMFLNNFVDDHPDIFVEHHRARLAEDMHRQLADSFKGVAIKMPVGKALGMYLGKDAQGKSLLGDDGKPLAKGSLLSPAEAKDSVGRRSPFVILDTSHPAFKSMSLHAGWLKNMATFLHEAGEHSSAADLEKLVANLGLPDGELLQARNAGDITAKVFDAVKQHEKTTGEKAEVYVVPRGYHDAIEQEAARANGALHSMLRSYGDVWKIAVLHGRFPAWFRNNFLGSGFLLSVASNPVAALEALRKTTEVMVQHDPEALAHLQELQKRLPRVATATGSNQMARLYTSEHGGHVRQAVNKLNDFNAKWADEPFRLGRAQQILEEITNQYMERTGHRPEDVNALYKKMLEDSAVRRVVTERTLNDMIDFTNLSQRERDWVATFIPFYSWMKGSVGVGLRLVINKPTVAALLAHESQTGYQQTMDALGPAAPDFTKAAWVLPSSLQNEWGTREMSTLGMNPLQSPADAFTQALQLLPWSRKLGGPSYRGFGSESLASNLNPALLGGLAALTGQDPFFGTPLPTHQSIGSTFVQQGVQGIPLVSQIEKLIMAHQGLAGGQSGKSVQLTTEPMILSQMAGVGLRDIRPSAAYARGAQEYQQHYGPDKP